MDALKSLSDLFAAVDRAFAEVENQFSDEVQCGSGCNDCCYAVFDVSMIEAVSLAKAYLALGDDQKHEIIIAGRQATEQWQDTITNQTDLAKARIRCPLLSKQGLCLCYEHRPVNCRTYGVPTVIGGAGHVCGFSGFEPGRQYPTINLEQLQQILYDLSVQLYGQEIGRKRWPVAEILLHPGKIISP